MSGVGGLAFASAWVKKYKQLQEKEAVLVLIGTSECTCMCNHCLLFFVSCILKLNCISLLI